MSNISIHSSFSTSSLPALSIHHIFLPRTRLPLNLASLATQRFILIFLLHFHTSDSCSIIYLYPRGLQSSPFQPHHTSCFPPSSLHLVPSYISTLAASRTHKTSIRQRVTGSHPIYSLRASLVVPLRSRQYNLSSPSFPSAVCSAAPSLPCLLLLLAINKTLSYGSSPSTSLPCLSSPFMRGQTTPFNIFPPLPSVFFQRMFAIRVTLSAWELKRVNMLPSFNRRLL